MNTYIKFLSNNKFYTFVSVFGFAVSLMFVFLIAVYVKQELSVDNFHEKKDRIFLLATNSQFGVRYSYGAIVKDLFPEVEEAIPMALSYETEVVEIDNKRLNARTAIVGENFFSVFTFPLLLGSKDHLLQSPESAVVSQSFARKIFGETDPVGKTIRYDNSVLVTISGVVADIKNSIIPDFDIILPYANLRSFQPYMDVSSGFAVVAVLANQGADLRTRNEDLTNYFKEKMEWDYEHVLSEKIQFVPLSEVYFSDLFSWQLNRGNRSFVMILLAVGVVILLFSIFNYINLTVAQTGFRAREMATRNLLGARSTESFVRLIVESIVLILFSLSLGIFLAYACVSYVNNVLNTQLYLTDFFSLPNIIGILFISILLGVISGIFPAYMISNFKPIDVVKGSFKIRNKMVFSKVFIVIQNVLTIVLITSSIVISRQIDHLIKAPLGYNTENIVLIDVKYDQNTLNTLVDRLENLASVKRVALASGVPLTDTGYSTFEHDGKVIHYSVFEGDPLFFSMLDFEVLRDNQLGYDHVNYYTEETYKLLGMDDDEIVMPVFNWHVGGKIKDIQIGDIHQGDRTVTIIAKKERNRFKARRILVETQGDQTEAYKQIGELYNKTTTLDFEGKYLADIVKENFVEQRRLQKIINLFSAIAILISLLGLIAISTYFIRQRTKEVAIKKIMGSTTESIMTGLIRSFLYYVLIAFVIAVPIAYYFMRDWLDDFSYRIGLSSFYFIAAGLFCLIISMLTIFYQSYRAAIASPVESLKNE